MSRCCDDCLAVEPRGDGSVFVPVCANPSCKCHENRCCPACSMIGVLKDRERGGEMTAAVCIKPSCPNCHTLPQEKRCCSGGGGMYGVHTETCPKMNLVKPQEKCVCGAPEEISGGLPLWCKKCGRQVSGEPQDIQPEWDELARQCNIRNLPFQEVLYLVKEICLSRDMKLRGAFTDEIENTSEDMMGQFREGWIAGLRMAKTLLDNPPQHD